MSEVATRIAIAVVEHDGRFLVGTRPAGKPLAGYAEFPGGRVEQGETPRDAAVRECREETGLSIEVVSEYERRVHDYAHDRVQLHFLACKLTGTETRALAPFRWVSRAELCRLEFPAANRELVSALVADKESSEPIK